MSLAWTSDPLWLVINVLVAYRLTRLWTEDYLPPLPMIRFKINEWAERRWDNRIDIERAKREVPRDMSGVTDLERAYNEGPPLARLADCPWCVGFWACLGVFLAASLIPAGVWIFLAVPLAMSAAIGIIASRT